MSLLRSDTKPRVFGIINHIIFMDLWCNYYMYVHNNNYFLTFSFPSLLPCSLTPLPPPTNQSPSPLPSPCCTCLAPSHRAEPQAQRNHPPQQPHSVWTGRWSAWRDIAWCNGEKKVENLQRKIQSDSSHNCGWWEIHSRGFLSRWEELMDWRD